MSCPSPNSISQELHKQQLSWATAVRRYDGCRGPGGNHHKVQPPVGQGYYDEVWRRVERQNEVKRLFKIVFFFNSESETTFCESVMNHVICVLPFKLQISEHCDNERVRVKVTRGATMGGLPLRAEGGRPTPLRCSGGPAATARGWRAVRRWRGTNHAERRPFRSSGEVFSPCFVKANRSVHCETLIPW